VCHRFRLGFRADEVIAQEDWWGGWLSGPLERAPGLRESEVLVANVSDPTNEAKRRWLGSHARLVAIPDFNGEADAWAWQNYIAVIRDELMT
jgi:hypothetical protein